MDKSTAVRDKAFQIMSQNYYKPNADLIFQELANDQSDCLPIITKYATSIFKTVYFGLFSLNRIFEMSLLFNSR